jgi:RimJ/RimL family protein N-acetyltransferase
LGLPSVVLAIAANQEASATAFGEAGAVLYLGRGEEVSDTAIRAAVDTLIASPSLAARLSSASSAAVDGLGATRVSSKMTGRDVTLRTAVRDDVEVVYKWRNHPSTRKFFFNSDPVDRAEHQQWFSASLKSSSRRLLVATTGSVDIGVVRLDISEQSAEVSIYLRPGLTGRGLGSEVLRSTETWVRGALPTVRRLTAQIRVENRASIAAFEDAGYLRQVEVFSLDLDGQERQ